MLAMAAGACAVTLWAQRGVVIPMESVSFLSRIENAAVSYGGYLRQTFCPTGLALWYPLPISGFPGWKIATSVALLTVVTGRAGWSEKVSVHPGRLAVVFGHVGARDRLGAGH